MAQLYTQAQLILHEIHNWLNPLQIVSVYLCRIKQRNREKYANLLAMHTKKVIKEALGS